MPRFDGTGPRGQGAGTGRGLGPCGGGRVMLPKKSVVARKKKKAKAGKK